MTSTSPSLSPPSGAILKILNPQSETRDSSKSHLIPLHQVSVAPPEKCFLKKPSGLLILMKYFSVCAPRDLSGLCLGQSGLLKISPRNEATGS